MLHAHSLRERRPRGAVGWPAVLEVRRYRCANEACAAIWLVLPGFLARRLWRVWETVQAAALTPPPPHSDEEPKHHSVPARTHSRWIRRLLCNALLLVQVLTTGGSELQAALAQEVGLEATRQDLVQGYSQHTGAEHPLTDLAALIHRLSPGVRLM